MKKLLSALYVLILIAGFHAALQGQSVNIQQAVSINDDGIAPREGSILDLGLSNKPIKIPINIQDSIDQLSLAEGMLVYNIDSARYEVTYAQYNQTDKGSSNYNVNTSALLSQLGSDFPTMQLESDGFIDSISVFIKDCPQAFSSIYFDLYEFESGICNNLQVIAGTNAIVPATINTLSWQTFAFNVPIPLQQNKVYTLVINGNNACNTTYANQVSYSPNIGLLELNNCTLNDANEVNVIFHIKEKVHLWAKLH